jgi:hypothetical protein
MIRIPQKAPVQNRAFFAGGKSGGKQAEGHFMSANIRDIEALHNFRAKLMRFAEEVDGSLQTLHLETRRAIEWIEFDCPHYWTAQMRKSFDLVASTRTALTTCQMRTVAGRRSSCIEEKVAYDRAKRRLQHCQEQIEQIKRWAQKIRHDSEEFQGRLTALRRLLDQDIPQALAWLERSSAALERYADLSRPAGNDSAPAPFRPAVSPAPEQEG